MKPKLFILLISFLFLTISSLMAQNCYELNAGWRCLNISSTNADGFTLSNPSYPINNALPAVVPGTVLTTLLANQKIADPFFGMNNNHIADIYNTGAKYYTYWFINDFKQSPVKTGEQLYLNLRGVNYSCEIFLNGKKVNAKVQTGMFLRSEYNITQLLNKNGHNRLSVLVLPPPDVGDPNGGQGGDGTIARGVGTQYTAGWDWIQPIRDRNTGIWDKVTLIKTGKAHLKDPHIITLVPGIRQTDGLQQPAIIKASAEVENPTAQTITGVLRYEIAGQVVLKHVQIGAKLTAHIQLNDLQLKNPMLWWPNGYGPQNLYNTRMQFICDGTISDQEQISIGVREIETTWNSTTRSRQIAVNGQKIFVKGGNWIVSDAMLRFSEERYDAEIRFHRDMNLNMIRVWGGALVERPEFYAACDKYGLLVFQDLWISGDCNGKWLDPMKLDDQWARRQYPNDHQLFVASAADQVKMVRNHASLAVWCGGNEITPPQDILTALRDSIMPHFDGTRWFVDYSNSDEMSMNTLGGNGDGPYGIQSPQYFWEYHTFPFNSEIGSVGIGDYESLARIIPSANLKQVPAADGKVDSVWQYHKYIGYDGAIAPYGSATDVPDFCKKAQLVNYDQYRALAEGFSAHMWDWYTGVIIWKTQNPWTALRGQMYDYYLDPNACLYGLKSGSEPIHTMYNPVDGMVTIVNNTFKPQRDMMLTIKMYDMAGKETAVTQVFEEVLPSSVKKFINIKEDLTKAAASEGVFLALRLTDKYKQIISDNVYWLPDGSGKYSGLANIPHSKLSIGAAYLGKGKIAVTLINPPSSPVAFFNRLALVDAVTKNRVLPVFYADNYVSVLPGESKTIAIDCDKINTSSLPLLSISGWNLPEKLITINTLNKNHN